MDKEQIEAAIVTAKRAKELADKATPNPELMRYEHGGGRSHGDKPWPGYTSQHTARGEDRRGGLGQVIDGHYLPNAFAQWRKCRRQHTERRKSE